MDNRRRVSGGPVTVRRMRGGLLIREARLRAGLTQAQLAERLGASPGDVDRWEGGAAEPPYASVAAAARACELQLIPRLAKLDDSEYLTAHWHLDLSVAGRLRVLRDMLNQERTLWDAGRRNGLIAEERLPYETRPMLQAEAILEVLARHRVRFVVIGGVAAILHGSPFATRDADITPAMDRENLERLGGALRELEAHLRTPDDPGADLPFDPVAELLGRGQVWNLTTPFGDLDLSFVPAGTTGYDDLLRDATILELAGLRVRVASLADVIRSKEAAGRDKDLQVVPTLRKLLERLDEQSRRD